MKKYSLAFLVISTILSAQEPKKPDPWKRFAQFVGVWDGTSEGQPGSATVEREYTFVLKNKFVQVKNKSTYAPQSKNPKGEIHEDMGMISFDGRRKTFVFRQFHVEGFINQYVLDTLASNEKQIVMVTEAIENIPPGWKARETYTLISNDEFHEVFELAEPGKEYEVYSKGRFVRKK